MNGVYSTLRLQGLTTGTPGCTGREEGQEAARPAGSGGQGEELSAARGAAAFCVGSMSLFTTRVGPGRHSRCAFRASAPRKQPAAACSTWPLRHPPLAALRSTHVTAEGPHLFAAQPCHAPARTRPLLEPREGLSCRTGSLVRRACQRAGRKREKAGAGAAGPRAPGPRQAPRTSENPSPTPFLAKLFFFLPLTV